MYKRIFEHKLDGTFFSIPRKIRIIGRMYSKALRPRLESLEERRQALSIQRKTNPKIYVGQEKQNTYARVPTKCFGSNGPMRQDTSAYWTNIDLDIPDEVWGWSELCFLLGAGFHTIEENDRIRSFIGREERLVYFSSGVFAIDLVLGIMKELEA